ncbi:hypothetical protein AB4Z10_26155 [Bosea sp. RAF48]
MIVHQNAKATSIIRMNLDGEKRVLMVDTDLKLDGEHPNYSAKKLFSLKQACQSFVDGNPELVDTYAIRAWN